MRAMEADNPANGVYYAGTFLLRDNVNPSEVRGDTCHASSAGELALGDQSIASSDRKERQSRGRGDRLSLRSRGLGA